MMMRSSRMGIRVLHPAEIARMILMGRMQTSKVWQETGSRKRQLDTAEMNVCVDKGRSLFNSCLFLGLVAV